MVAGRGVAQLITGGQIITVYYAPCFFFGNGFLLGLPFAVFIAAVTWGVVQLALTRTALGLFIQAIGINPAAARPAGLRARRITVGAYAFRSLCAGLAGIIVSSNVKSADGNNAGQPMELDAILAVTLGGTLLGGRALQCRWQRDWCADHPDADDDDLFGGRATRGQHGRQGTGGVCGHAAAVAGVSLHGAGLGAVVALSTLVSAALVERHHLSATQVIPQVLLMGAAFGGLMGWLIQRLRLQPFIVTLAGMFLARGLCHLIGIDSISITNADCTSITQARLPL